MLARSALFLSAGLGAALASAIASGVADARRTSPVAVASNDTTLLLRAVNAERRAARLGFLSLDLRLCAIAQHYANDMARRNYFGHVSPEGLDPFARMRRAGYRFRWAGENIGLNADAARTQDALFLDPPHRANILRPTFGHVGIGTSRWRGGTLVVEDFSD
jgi:uncharacterized protein YkwD